MKFYTIKTSKTLMSSEQTTMEWASKVMNAATRASTNNAMINVVLLGAFGALSVRSLSQQRNIETLEAEKDSLLKSNKAMKKTMWDWKQQLFAEASSSPETSFVPLSKLKSIYGESSTTLQSSAEKGDGKSAASKIVI
ncbi:hypothetical protein ACSBR2_029867 [Camellia fascicularis]